MPERAVGHSGPRGPGEQKNILYTVCMGAGQGRARRTKAGISGGKPDDVGRRKANLRKANLLPAGTTEHAEYDADNNKKRFVMRVSYHVFSVYDVEKAEAVQHFGAKQYGGDKAAREAARQCVDEENAREDSRRQEAEEKEEKRKEMERSAHSIKQVNF